MLLCLVIPLYDARADELWGQWDSLDVLGGEYRVNNNIWGASTAQEVTVYPDSTYFSVTYSEHDQSTVASYPFIQKGPHWGYTNTLDSGLPIEVSDVVAAPFAWSVDTNDAGGTWNVAYESWFSKTLANATTPGTNPDAAELMIWIDWQGDIGPGGSKVATAVPIGGYNWDVYHASPWSTWDHYIAYKVTTPANYVELDLKDFMDDSLTRGFLDPAWYLDNMEAGFEIWQDGQGLTSNSFSGSVIPEPASASIMALGAAILALRRRHH
jgi:cellulose 1,4-beta-cellobiosidase